MSFVERRLHSLLGHDLAPGLALVGAAALALLIVNSGLHPLYDALLGTVMAVQVGAFAIDKPLLLWINDGLMALFFFYVGLEIKREILEGRLSSPRRAALPAIAATGGIIVPAVIYAAINWGDAAALEGWAIPAATDIAFALGVLALLGTRAPVALKVFLLAVAVIDDLAAILIIAFFYTSTVSWSALAVAAAGGLALVALNRLRVSGIGPYAIVGLIVWAAVLKSGVHATLAGVVTAFAIPMRCVDDPGRHPVAEAEHWLKPWVLFAVMPIFAFANAGVPLTGLSVADLTASVPLGIAAGLFIGKQLGVFSFALLAVKTGVAQLPRGVTWIQVYGASLLAGVGFTMSLFIGALAFDDPSQQNAVRLGVLFGSVLSATLGYFVLRVALRKPAPARMPANTVPAE